VESKRPGGENRPGRTKQPLATPVSSQLRPYLGSCSRQSHLRLQWVESRPERL